MRAHPISETTNNPDPATILVCENDTANRMLAERIMVIAGYLCLTATNGQEALDTLARQRVDLMLTDLSMPIMDGFSLVRRVRQQATFDRLPIVALTASVNPTERQRLRWLGCDEVLAKPYHPKDLLALIAQLLAGAPILKESDGHQAALLRGAP